MAKTSNHGGSTTVNMMGENELLGDGAQPVNVRVAVSPVAPEVDPEGRWSVRAFTENGAMYAMIDAIDAGQLESNALKMAVYNYRLNVGQAGAGIEPMGGLFAVEATDPIQPVIKPGKGERVWRRIYKYNPPI